MSRLSDLNKQDAARRHWVRPISEGPSKEGLRRMLAHAAANTQASADSAATVRSARQERRA